MEVMVSKQDDEKSPSKWDVEEAVRTLLRAEEIKKDKKLMPLVKTALAKKGEAIEKISSLAELREVAGRQMDSEEGDKEPEDEEE